MAGTISGPRGSEPIEQSGGLAIRSDGAPVGTPRSAINLISTPGVTPRVVDDPTPSFEKSDIGWDVSAEIALSVTTGQDLVAGVGTVVLIPALAGATRYLISRVQVIPEIVDVSPSVQPTIQVESPAAAQDHVVSTMLSVAGDNFQDLTMVSLRPILDSSAPNNLLNLVQTVNATATDYTVTVIVWGYVLTP